MAGKETQAPWVFHALSGLKKGVLPTPSPTAPQLLPAVQKPDSDRDRDIALTFFWSKVTSFADFWIIHLERS